MSTTQQNNDQNVDLLTAHFQKRYEPNFAWVNACSAHLALPGLRGFWPMSAFDGSGGAHDQSGNGRLLTINGNTYFSYDDLAPYARYDGTGDYHLRADEAGLDITGLETYVNNTERGLTMGCWCYPETTGSAETLMSKWESVGDDRSYMLDITAGDFFRAIISTDGTAGGIVSNLHATVFRTANSWFHAVMRFDPGSSLDIIVNGDEDNFATAAASIFSGAADFLVGAYDPGTGQPYQGRVALSFLCATQLSDAQIFALYQQTRALFGG